MKSLLSRVLECRGWTQDMELLGRLLSWFCLSVLSGNLIAFKLRCHADMCSAPLPPARQHVNFLNTAEKMLPWLLWIRAYVRKPTAVVLSVPPLVFFRASSSMWTAVWSIPAAVNGFCRQQQQHEFDVISANFPATCRITGSSGELMGGLFSALGCCLAKLLAAADTLECSLCRLKTTLRWFMFSYIWMVILATMKSENIFFQIFSF